MDTVKQYLGVLKEKKTWKELVSKNSSAMIMAVQIALYSQNYSFWSIDWILWDKTKQAIRKFQADNNLPVDTYGRSMPSTIQKLLEVISKEDQVELPQEEKKEAEKIMEEKENKGQIEEEHTPIVESYVETTTNETNLDESIQEEWGETSSVFYKPDENMEWINAQEIIRPEVQEWLNSSRNSDKLKQLTTITQAEAVAISEKWWYYLDLSWIKQINEKSFEELLKHRWLLNIWLENLTPELAKKLEESWKWITFSWLENIDNFEVYQILWRTNWTLRFSVLKNIFAKEMWELVKKPSWDIYLDAIENIDQNIAEEISKYPRDISLNWVKNISKETAEVLSNKKMWRLYLKWLKAPLDENLLEWIIQIPMQHLVVNNDVISQIYYYKKQKEREWKNLSQIVLDVMDNKINDDELSKLTSITYDEAEFLASSWKYYIDLSWIKKITPDTFETLLKFKWWIRIWLENLTPELVKKLEESWKWITFSWLENIDSETCKVLWKTKWTLDFEVLKSISAENMKELVKKPWWDICLNAMENISPEMAEEMIKFPRNIFLDWVKRIDKTTAEILSKKSTWVIYLRWLETPLSSEVLDELEKMSLIHINTKNDVLVQIDKYKKQKEIQWKDISPIVLDVLDGKVDKDDLSKLTKLTYDEAEILSKLWWYYVNLSWIKEIEERTFETLLKFNWKIRLWIDKLTPELANKLEWSDKYIIFSWLENIDSETCKVLWKTKWTLDFEVLKNISVENTKELVNKPWWDICLNAVESISPEVAEEMIKFPRNIFLDWVKKIDRTTAEILSKKNRWKFCLRWLETPLDDDILEIISKIPPHRFITSHEIIEQMYKYKKKK